jgi:hypothetical protein
VMSHVPVDERLVLARHAVGTADVVGGGGRTQVSTNRSAHLAVCAPVTRRQ